MRHDDAFSPTPGLDESLRATEAALSSLRPAGPAPDRAAVLIETGRALGRAQARREVFVWRGAAAVLFAALGASLWWRPGPGAHSSAGPMVIARADLPATTGPARGSPAVPTELPTTSDATSGQANYLALRDAVLRRGLSALPAAPSGGASSSEPQPTVEGLLGPPVGPERGRRGAAPSRFSNLFFLGANP